MSTNNNIVNICAASYSKYRTSFLMHSAMVWWWWWRPHVERIHSWITFKTPEIENRKRRTGEWAQCANTRCTFILHQFMLNANECMFIICWFTTNILHTHTRTSTINKNVQSLFWRCAKKIKTLAPHRRCDVDCCWRAMTVHVSSFVKIV